MTSNLCDIPFHGQRGFSLNSHQCKYIYLCRILFGVGYSRGGGYGQATRLGSQADWCASPERCGSMIKVAVRLGNIV